MNMNQHPCHLACIPATVCVLLLCASLSYAQGFKQPGKNANSLDSLGTPVLVSPVDNAGCLDSVVTFRWQPCAEADAYRFQVLLYPWLTNFYVLIDTVVSTTSFTDTINRGTNGLYEKIGWRVAAIRDTSQGTWSKYNSFQVKSWKLGCYMAFPRGDTNFVDSVRFIWYPNPCAERYIFRLSHDLNFRTVMYEDSTVTDTTIVIRGLPLAKKLYWRLQPYAEGYEGRMVYGQSEFRMHLGPPPVPATVSPIDYAETHRTVDLRWAAMGNTRTYDVLIRTGGERFVAHDSGLTWNLYPLSNLEIDTIYYWKVRGRNDHFTGEWSRAEHFVVRDNPVSINTSKDPHTCILENCYPHPVRGNSTARFFLPKPQYARLSLRDILGRELYVVFDGGVAERGWHNAVLPGRQLAPGLYFLHLRTGDALLQRRLLVSP